jgi:fatty-acyl-CoA synthase
VCADSAAFDEERAREALSARLARYKVPSFFLLYDALPLLGSGKIDTVTLRQDAIIRVNAMKK